MDFKEDFNTNKDEINKDEINKDEINKDEILENENKKQNKKIVIAAICITIACLIVFFSVLHLQRRNLLNAQEVAGIQQAPKTPQVQITKLIKSTTTTTTQPSTQPALKRIKLDCSSVQNDLKIKLLSADNGEYINGVAFSVVVTDSANKQITYTNKDLKGLIYVGNVKAGTYTIKLNVPGGCVASVDTVTVTVKNKVENKVIKDIKEKVEKNPNPKEDTKAPQKQNVVQEKVLQDTVEFVKSIAIEIPEKITYIPVAFASIRNPVLSETTTMGTTSELTSATVQTTSNEKLLDVNGNVLYVNEGNNYRVAYASDYNQSNQFFKREVTPKTYKYTGWQTIDGKRYFFDKNNNYVKGNQIINGAKYTFGADGVLSPGAGVLGIDVSKYQGNINWQAVKASGVQFAIIRAGYRGYGSGALVVDEYFERNIKGALAAGIDVGIYFFSQAINNVEAVEEASLCVALVKKYNIKYPIFIDTETSGGNGTGRADNLSVAQRTDICINFCNTIRNSGYKPGVYTCKYWFETKLNASQLNQYIIWLAQYNDKVTYKGKYDIWQYSSNGNIAGIAGRVDMNLSYMYF